MRKKNVVVLFLFTTFVVSLLYVKNMSITQKHAQEIAIQHPLVKQWVTKQRPNMLHVSHFTTSEDLHLVHSKRENKAWKMTFQTKSEQKPQLLSVTVDEGNVTTVTEQDRVLVFFKDEVNKETIEGTGGEVLSVAEEIPIATAAVPPEEIENLKQNRDVLLVEKDQIISVHQQNMDWGIGKINSPTAWRSNLTGKGIKISVVDTGIDTGHVDLRIAGGTSVVSYTTSYNDDNGHGTHVTGIIGALNNNVGTVGVAPDADIYAVKVLDETGAGFLSDIIKGIDWSITNKMDIINLSLGSEEPSLSLQSIVKKAYDNGILVVASSGNSGSSPTLNTMNYPAQYNSVISVGAVDSSLKVANFSSSGPTLETTAPGVNILSTYKENSYEILSGTSMAAPYVTGNLALIKQANPEASVDQLRTLLQNNVLDLGDFGRDHLYGYGFIQSSSSYSLHGRNRYETSVNISRFGWPNGSNSLILGRGDLPIDALTGSVLASKLFSPVLLTDSKTLPPEINTEIKRLNPKSIFLLGGELAISKNIENNLVNSGYIVSRINGVNRFDTSVKVAQKVGNQGEVFLTTSNNSPDPLSIASYAGITGKPILLTGQSALSKEVKDFIINESLTKVTIIGGETAVSKKIEEDLTSIGIKEVERIAGTDRFTTSIQIFKTYQTTLNGPVYSASGTSFIDALPGASLAALSHSPVVLIHRDFVPIPVINFFDTTYSGNRNLRFLGGYSVIGIYTRSSLEKLMKSPIQFIYE